MKRVALLVIVPLVLAGWIFVEPAVACPNCKTTVENNGGSMALGYALSILIMLATPATILAAWAIGILRLARQMKG